MPCTETAQCTDFVFIETFCFVQEKFAGSFPGSFSERFDVFKPHIAYFDIELTSEFKPFFEL